MSDVLDMWQRLEASMDAVHATRACREAVQALEVIQSQGGEAGEMAAAAIRRVVAELNAEDDLDG